MGPSVHGIEPSGGLGGRTASGEDMGHLWLASRFLFSSDSQTVLVLEYRSWWGVRGGMPVCGNGYRYRYHTRVEWERWHFRYVLVLVQVWLMPWQGQGLRDPFGDFVDLEVQLRATYRL